MWSKEPQMQQTSFFPSWHTMFLPFSSLQSDKYVNIITKMYALRNLPVGANVNHVVVGSTLFTILRRKTQVVNFCCRFITCITPYSFIGFTPYSLVCLKGHVLLPWIFDLQELWVRQSRRAKAYLHQKQGFWDSSFSIRQNPSSKGVADDGTMPLCIT